MLEHLWYLLYGASLMAGLITVVTGVYFRKVMPYALIAVLPITGSFLSDLVGIILILNKMKEQCLMLLNFFPAVDIWLNVAVVVYFISNRKINTYIVCAAMLATALVAYYIHAKADIFNNWGVVAVATVLVAVFVTAFIILYNNTLHGLTANLFFWICISTLLFFSCNIPLFCSINYLINLPHKVVYPVLMFIILLLNISRYLLLFTGLLVVNKRLSR